MWERDRATASRLDRLREAQKSTRQGIPQLPRGAEYATEIAEDGDATLDAGRADARQDLLSARAAGVAIAAEDLSVGDRRADGLVGGPTGGLTARMLEKEEEFVLMVGEMLGEPGVGRVRESPVQQALQPGLKATDGDRHAMRRNLALVPTVAKEEGVREELQDRPGKSNRPAGGEFEDVLAASLDVAEALLVEGLLESIVGAPPVMDHRAVPIRPENLLGDIVAAAGSDWEQGRRTSHEDPHPLKKSIDLPSGLIGVDASAATHDDFDAVIGGLNAVGCPQDDVGGPATRERDPEEVLEDRLDVAIGDADLVLQERRHGLGVRSQLRSRRSDGIGGLKRMASLHAPAAVVTVPDVDVESPVDRLLGNLGLELPDRSLAREVSPTLAVRREGHGNDLVDVFRRRTVGLHPVVFAGLATPRLGSVMGVPLEKGAA